MLDFTFVLILLFLIKFIIAIQVLDPIDGTRGFLKGCEALYVVCSTF